MSDIDASASSPDGNAAKLTATPVDPLRYDGHTSDPTEIAGMLQQLMPGGVRVLDIGCGTGSVTVIANGGKGNEVLAIEPDRDRAAVARSRGLDVEEGFLDERFLRAHEKFDVVMASDVLEHVAAPAELLGLMIEAAKPGGMLLISVPNVAHWSVRWNLLRGRFDLEPHGIMDATHLRWFTARTVCELVEASGCKVVKLLQTSGTSLVLYRRSVFRRLPNRLVDKAVRQLAGSFPKLFGAQHVLVVRTPA